MSAIIKACKKAASINNTRSECNESMGPTSMLFMVPASTKWTATDMLDFTGYLLGLTHAGKATRIYPMFGPEVPIRKITTSKESDVIPVQDDGTPIFVRYGSLTRSFSTTEGGLCFAQAAISFNKSGYSAIEVDNANQLLFRDNKDGTYSALKTTFVYSPSPDLADLKNPGYTNFQLSYRPEEYVSFGVVFQAEADITSVLGLYDVSLFIPAALPSTTTKLKFNAETTCGETDLAALLGADLAQITNFIVTNKLTGVVVTSTAAAIVAGHVELTGTYVSGQTYVITPAAASVWFTNGIEGYEGINSIEISIP